MTRSVWGWLQHAFATGPQGPCEPTPVQLELIDKVCRWAIARGMELPLQVALQSSAPLGSLAGQSLPVLQPWLGLMLTETQIREIGRFLEHRGAIEYLSRRLEILSRTESRSPQADAGAANPRKSDIEQFQGG